jgi:hypothetical protein
MTRRTRTILYSVAALVGFFFCSAIALFLHSEKLDAVTVRFTGPGAEPKDTGLYTRLTHSELPDYRVEILYTRGSYSTRTVPNASAAQPIRFAVHGDIRLGDVRELVLHELGSDKENSMARVPFAPPSMSSNGYVFTFESSRDFDTGLTWYFRTPIGGVVAVAVGLVILILLVRFNPWG